MQTTSPIQREAGVLSTNKVLRQTYALLSMTLLFSAAMAGLSMFLAVPPAVSMATSIAAIGLIWFVMPRVEESAAGIWVVFLFTGLLGFGLGPMLSMYLKLPNGPQVVSTAMGGTGAIFLALSGYVLTTKKDFSYMAGFLMVGLIVAFGAMLLNLFLNIPALSLAVSAGIILIMSGFILFDTSRIVNGGETNYVRATTGLFLNIYNIFVSLLQILGIMGDD